MFTILGALRDDVRVSYALKSLSLVHIYMKNDACFSRCR